MSSDDELLRSMVEQCAVGPRRPLLRYVCSDPEPHGEHWTSDISLCNGVAEETR